MFLSSEQNITHTRENQIVEKFKGEFTFVYKRETLTQTVSLPTYTGAYKHLIVNFNHVSFDK